MIFDLKKGGEMIDKKIKKIIVEDSETNWGKDDFKKGDLLRAGLFCFAAFLFLIAVLSRFWGA